jgi:hypothetical protein
LRARRHKRHAEGRQQAGRNQRADRASMLRRPPGQTLYRVELVTLQAPDRPLIFTKFGTPAPPAVNAEVPRMYPGRP